MKTDFQDRIDEYLLGRISDGEKTQFEAEVNQDESKREQLEFTRNVKGAISSREDKMAKLKMMQRKYDREHQQVAASVRATGTDDCLYSPAPQYVAEKKPSKRIWWWASGIAAALVIGLFALRPVVTNDTAEPMYKMRGDDFIFDAGSSDVRDTIVRDSILRDSTVIDTLVRDTALVYGSNMNVDEE